jgi:hypothetical protein
VVIALAGRRIDADDAGTPGFPLANVALVRRRLGELFAREAATTLVSSAACGADLAALTVAGERRMRRRVVLPFDRRTFRATSVVDRPGPWGSLYDDLLVELEATADVVTLSGPAEGNEAYAATNTAILREAVAMAGPPGVGVVAVLVWEGVSRGDDDMTAAFGDGARSLGVRVDQVLTL